MSKGVKRYNLIGVTRCNLSSVKRYNLSSVNRYNLSGFNGFKNLILAGTSFSQVMGDSPGPKAAVSIILDYIQLYCTVRYSNAL